jgi:hypothetical protein
MRRALDIEELDAGSGLFRHPASVLWRPPNGHGVFGGQILAGAMQVRAVH